MLNHKSFTLMTVVGLMLSLSTLDASARDVYKWVDEQGNTHYSDRSTEKAKKIRVSAPPTNPTEDEQARNKKRDQLLNVLEEEREDKKQAKVDAEEEKASREEKCEEAKANLQKYQTAGYLYKLDDEGERQVLNDEEYTKAIERAEMAVKDWCE